MWLAIGYFLVYNFLKSFVASWHLLAWCVKGEGRSETKIYFWTRLVQSFICIVWTSWMVCGQVEWDWHMGMSYLTSLNPQLSKNIAYVGSFKHFSVQLILHVFCNSSKTSANNSVWIFNFCCLEVGAQNECDRWEENVTLHCRPKAGIIEMNGGTEAKDREEEREEETR